MNSDRPKIIQVTIEGNADEESKRYGKLIEDELHQFMCETGEYDQLRALMDVEAQKFLDELMFGRMP